jgi:hypothetical protein
MELAATSRMLMQYHTLPSIHILKAQYSLFNGGGILHHIGERFEVITRQLEGAEVHSKLSTMYVKSSLVSDHQAP